jgi:hypothetical protein
VSVSSPYLAVLVVPRDVPVRSPVAQRARTGSVASLMGSLIKKRRKRMRKKKHKKMLRRTRHQRRK